MSSVNGTTPIPPQQLYRSPYGYTPTEYVCIIFVALFGLSTLVHVGQAIYYRLWWLFPTAVLAGLSEVIGWAGRLWSSRNPGLITPFLMQITTTIIAPTPLVAANFIILGKIIHRLGREYSRLSPKMYTIIFCSFDLVALVVQAVGGASASRAAQEHRDASKGGNIMLGGIAFQMAAITLYVACAAEFLVRYFTRRPIRPVDPAAVPEHTESSSVSSRQHEKTTVSPGRTHNVLSKKLKLMILALVFSTLVIFIRSIYRTIELADGWTGRIITTEVYFNVLDGTMITLAMFTLNFLHPGYLLK